MTTHDEIRDTIEKLLSRNTAKSSFLARQLMFSVLPPSYFVENYLYDNEGRLQKLEDFPMLKHIYDNMPQKLLLKCSRKTLKSTLLSNFICLNLIRWNYFKMMYVGPQEMTTKYFSSNYLPPRFESPKIKNLLLKGWFKNDVFEKILDDTHSSVLFRYVSDDATRTRGPAVDCLVYDECVSKNTFTLTKLSTGEVVQRRILDMHIGDVIVAYDSNRNIKYDKIKSIKSRGDRHCWKITLSDGSLLECTAGSRILTNKGWCYLAQLLPKREIVRCAKAISIESAYLSAKAINSRNLAGRRFYGVHGEVSKIPSESGYQTEGIYLAQGENIRELYKHSASNLPESGVRLSECGFHYGDYSSIRLYTYSMLQESRGEIYKECKHGVAAGVDLGGDSLLVYGRRSPSQKRKHNTEYSGIPGAGGKIASTMAHRYGDCSTSEKNLELLDCSHKQKEFTSVYTECTPVYNPGAAIQVSDSNKAMLLRGSADGLKYAELQELSSSCGKAIQGGLASEKKAGRSLVSRRYQAERQELQKQKEKRPREIQKTARVLESSGSITEAGSCLASEEEPAGAFEKVETKASIVSIEYIGILPVYDLETEIYHTFFANGIAVHNCQDIQHDQIPIIQETMAMSPYKREIFAGTPLDSTNTIHRLWKTTNQLEWMMKCEGCNHWNSLTEGNDPLKMIQPHGFSCSKCGKVLNSRNGEWVSTNPSSYLMTGYHLAQPILPHFNEDPKEWREIYEKVHSGKNELRVVMNETFGLSYDVGSKPITQEELVRLCTLGPQFTDNSESSMAILNKNKSGYKLYTMGVDWGVSMAQSRTVATLGAMRGDGIFEIILAKIYRGYDYEAHIRDIADRANAVGAFCVSDSGPDPIRGIKLCELTSPQRSQLAAYRRTKMIQHFEPGSYDWRQNRWVLHRSDVISLVIRQLKAGKILFPQWGDVSEYMQDILNVFIEVRDGLYGQELIYDHHPKQPDDAMHSLVFAVCAAYMAIGDAGLLGPSSTSGTEPIMIS